jgi:hypothetical protein
MKMHYVYMSTFWYLKFVAQHFVTQHFVTQHFVAQHLVAWHFVAQHFVAQHFVARHFVARHFVARHFVARHLVAQHFVAQHLVAWHFVAQHFVNQHFGLWQKPSFPQAPTWIGRSWWSRWLRCARTNEGWLWTRRSARLTSSSELAEFVWGRFLNRVQVENFASCKHDGINLFTSSLKLAKFRFWNWFKNRPQNLQSSEFAEFRTCIVQNLQNSELWKFVKHAVVRLSWRTLIPWGELWSSGVDCSPL